jgi:maltooligosyltrehalose trehalohydrolase
MTRRRHELPFGAEPTADGVRFRLWAPHAGMVSVRLEGADPHRFPMTREPDGWFSLTTGSAASGTRYRYGIDGEIYPDPASRGQPEGVHGPSEVVDAAEFLWRDLGWRGRPWEEIVLYELHLGCFSETGDCAGAEQHLDHIRELGATAVELMPVAEFPGTRNWGYDGVFPFAPASRYGRPEALKRLVEACHERGLAIFLDVVYNHFGPEGNYLPAIAADFFNPARQTPWGAALDFSGPRRRPVRQFFIENALYWLEEFQFDGLRLDAVHAIADDSTPDIVDEVGETVRRRIRDREIHLVLENDRNEARRLARRNGRAEHFTAQWNDDLHHALHVLITGETSGFYGDYATEPARQLGRALAEGFAYQGEPSPFRDNRPRGEPSAQLPATAFVAFLQNHDHVGNHPLGLRLSVRAAEPAMHAGIAVVLLAPQIPLLFMGEEWGSRRPFAFFCDFAPDLALSVREGRRREFAHFPEFRDASARSRIPDPTALSTFLMSRLDWAEPREEGHARWLARYRRLLAIRSQEIVPRLAGIPPFAGSYRLLAPKAVSVEWRLGDGSCLLLVVNFSDRPVPVPEVARRGRMIYASERPGAALSATFFLLPAPSG